MGATSAQLPLSLPLTDPPLTHTHLHLARRLDIGGGHRQSDRHHLSHTRPPPWHDVACASARHSRLDDGVVIRERGVALPFASGGGRRGVAAARRHGCESREEGRGGTRGGRGATLSVCVCVCVEWSGGAGVGERLCVGGRGALSARRARERESAGAARGEETHFDRPSTLSLPHHSPDHHLARRHLAPLHGVHHALPGRRVHA